MKAEGKAEGLLIARQQEDAAHLQADNEELAMEEMCLDTQELSEKMRMELLLAAFANSGSNRPGNGDGGPPTSVTTDPMQPDFSTPRHIGGGGGTALKLTGAFGSTSTDMQPGST